MPGDAFEMNYIFTDGEGATDNNQGKNYMTAVRSAMTPEAWEEKAIDRQASKSQQESCLESSCKQPVVGSVSGKSKCKVRVKSAEFLVFKTLLRKI